MDRTRSKRQLARLIEKFTSRLKSLVRVLSSLRLGHQLGLVISDYSLRLCLVRRLFHSSRVIDLASYALDPDKAGDWTAKVEAAASIISGYLKEHRLKGVPVNIGLLGEDIAFRRMSLPDMPSKELASAVKWEGQKLFPFDLEQCSVDFRVLKKTDMGEPGQIYINVVAAKNEIIDLTYERFRGGNLKVGQIGFLPSFMASLLSRPVAASDENCDMIFHLDDDQSMAIFVHNGSLEFFQQFVTRPAAQNENDTMPVNIDSIVAELISFIDLYNGQSSGNILSNIYLGGKYAATGETADYIAENTGIPCSPVNNSTPRPDLFHGLTGEQTAAFLDVILTGHADPAYHPLAPRNIRRQEENLRLMARLGVVTGMAVLTVGGMHLELSHREMHTRIDLESKREMVRAFENSPGYRGYINLIGKLDRSQAYLNKMRDKYNSRFHLLMKELSLLLPDHINLTSVDLQKEDSIYVMSIDGHVRLTGFSPEIVLAEYVELLGNSPFFDNVAVAGHSKKRYQGSFDLTFQLRMDTEV